MILAGVLQRSWRPTLGPDSTKKLVARYYPACCVEEMLAYVKLGAETIDRINQNKFDQLQRT